MMIIVHRAQTHLLDRTHLFDPSAGGKLWQRLGSQSGPDALAQGFGPLIFLDEEQLPPSGTVLDRAPNDGETVVYMRQGALAYADPSGQPGGVLLAGEFLRTPRVHGGDTNASSTDWARLFWIGLRAHLSQPRSSSRKRRFTAGERRGRLCVVASADARRNSLRIQQDMQMYSSLLDPGQHVIHEISAGRRVWLHLVHGGANVSGHILTTADAASLEGELAVSVTARGESEILLFDVSGQSLASHESTNGV